MPQVRTPAAHLSRVTVLTVWGRGFYFISFIFFYFTFFDPFFISFIFPFYLFLLFFILYW